MMLTFWLGTGTSIKSGGDKLVLNEHTCGYQNFHEINCSCCGDHCMVVVFTSTYEITPSVVQWLVCCLETGKS